MSVMFRNSQYMVLYECFGVEPVDGICPPDHEEVQVWGQQYVSTHATQHMLTDIAAQRTCVDVSNMVTVPKNGR